MIVFLFNIGQKQITWPWQKCHLLKLYLSTQDGSRRWNKKSKNEGDLKSQWVPLKTTTKPTGSFKLNNQTFQMNTFTITTNCHRFLIMCVILSYCVRLNRKRNIRSKIMMTRVKISIIIKKFCFVLACLLLKSCFYFIFTTFFHFLGICCVS